MMMGIQSTAVWLAYLLSVVSAIGCVIYGVINWNKGASKVKKEDRAWLEKEEAREEEIS
jgi:heme exporter protein D